MKQKNRSLFYLLTFTMLLFSFSSLFAAVTVTYNNASFPYNTTGQSITAVVNTTEPIAAFDLISKVRSTVTNAFGTVTAINLGAIPATGSDLSQVDGATDDFTRAWAFGCTTPTVLTPGNYNITFTVNISCDTGQFVLEDGGDWVVDPDPVIATSMFVNTSAAAAALTVTPGTYRVYNTAPTITNCPSQALVFNACAVVTYDFNSSDPDIACLPAPDATWSIVTGPGSIDAVSGMFVWDPPAVAGICGLHEVTVKVTDEYGAFATCQFEISLITDAPYFTACPTPASELFIYWGWTADGDVDAEDPDDCPLALTYTLTGFTGPGTFTVDPVTGVWSWPTLPNDAYLGDFDVEITVSDGCISVPCNFTIHVAPTFTVVIEKTHNTIQGTYEFVDVTLEHWTEGFGGYDLLIAYDNSALSFVSAEMGNLLTNCEWEFFTYRYGPFGNCGGGCPSGQLRLVAIADMNTGFHHPTCFAQGHPTGPSDPLRVLATLKFLVTNDRTFECMFIPISFTWFDCGDNSFSSITGDTLFIDRKVYAYGSPSYIDITEQLWLGGWQGIDGDPNCMSLLLQKTHPDTVVDFFDGGIDIACADSIDARGDINLNGVANEIADAVLYSNYFLYGLGVFTIAPNGQIAASDVNGDGKVLTVGDLVYQLRVIVGDALPLPKLAPFNANAEISVVDGKISTNSSEAIGALYMTFEVTGSYNIAATTDMEVLSNLADDGKLHVLVYSGMSNMRNAIPAGNNELLTVTGADLISIEAADNFGNLMNTRVEKTALPTQFSLYQNVPNPFNPTTKIGFDLPVMSDWKLDIYNVSGQLVQSYNGNNIGHVDVTWSIGSNVPSGIYFYKVTAGSFTDTKKMVLMK